MEGKFMKGSFEIMDNVCCNVYSQRFKDKCSPCFPCSKVNTALDVLLKEHSRIHALFNEARGGVTRRELK